MIRVTVVSPEPTPYRAPLFDRIAARDDVDLSVLYAARTVADRSWSVALDHPHTFLRGLRVPGARSLLRHDYPLTPGVFRALGTSRPEVVVVSGWSTFASQAAVAWCRVRRVPYVLHVESHDLDPRRLETMGPPGYLAGVRKHLVLADVKADVEPKRVPLGHHGSFETSQPCSRLGGGRGRSLL